MNKRMLVFCAVICFALSLAACKERDGSQVPSLEDQLKSQINKEDDDYLNSYSGNYMELLKLDTIHYGSFTNKYKPELLTVFKVLGTPHAAGLDRTIAAVYDEDTMKIIAQKTFAADIVSIYFLPGYNSELEDILVIGDVTYQGITAYTAELFTLRDGDWAAKPMPLENTENNMAYAVTNDKLHIFVLSYHEHKPVYDYIETFFWNAAAEEFVRELP